jgi:hypothetical protein
METPTDVDFVRVMSLHKSKGLTARLVVVMGCNEGMIPRVDFDEPLAVQKRQLEEQRRLFYVAPTRTTETLVLSNVTYIPQQMAYGMGLGVNAGQASQFIMPVASDRASEGARSDAAECDSRGEAAGLAVAFVALTRLHLRLALLPAISGERLPHVVRFLEIASCAAPDEALIPPGVDQFPRRLLPPAGLLRRARFPCRLLRHGASGGSCATRVPARHIACFANPHEH